MLQKATMEQYLICQQKPLTFSPIRSSIYFALSNINNPYSQPSSIIYSLVAQGAVGELIRERPPQFMWNKMIDGAYNQLTLTFLGTDLQPIVIQDPSMTILLTIKEGDEYGGKN